MSALDIFVILLLGGGAIIGFVRGFVHEVLSLFAWVVAIAMLKLFHPSSLPGDRFRRDRAGGSGGGLRSTIHPISSWSSCWRGHWAEVQAIGVGAVDRCLGGFGMIKGLLGATLFFLLATCHRYGVRAEAERRKVDDDFGVSIPAQASGLAIVDWVEKGG